MLSRHQQTFVFHKSDDAKSENVERDLKELWSVLWLDVNYVIFCDDFLFFFAILSIIELSFPSKLVGIGFTLGLLNASQRKFN